MKKITITFVSNYINHHQKPLADALYQKLGEDYHFIQTMPMEEERVAMGWDTKINEIPYLVLLYENPEYAEKLIMESDVVIFGWSEREDLAEKRLRSGKASIRVSERIYREGQWKAISPRGLLAKYKEHIRYRNKPICMLCAGAYTASDFALIKSYPGKLLKWGYFPPFQKQDMQKLFEKKDAFAKEMAQGEEKFPLQIVWAGRFIPLKHPEFVIRLAETLHQKGYSFHIHMLGGGELEASLKAQVKEKGLENKILFYGFKTPEQVREMMEKCHIHLFTSNHLEGWGAVVNEGMNSGCVEVVNRQVGAAPFLIRSGENGFTYPRGSYEAFEQIVCQLFSDWEQYKKIGKAAYETIEQSWNADTASGRLLRFCENLLAGQIVPEQNGPLSLAPIRKPE